MIAQRFASLGHVAGVAAGAIGLYLISSQVAVERAKLEAVEREIGLAQREMRQLQTELGTRASLRQLEKWNGEVLALSAPKAGQYLSGEMQLASFDPGSLGDAPNRPPAVMTASAPAQVKPGAAEVRKANYVKPTEDAPKAERVALLEPASVATLIRTAAVESRPRP